jgi:hypothetical protein
MIRKIMFYAILVIILVLSNAGLVAPLLNNILGMSTSNDLGIFLKQSSQGFIVIFVMTLYLDFIKSNDTGGCRFSADDARFLHKILSEKFNTNDNAIENVASSLKLIYNSKNVINLLDTVVNNSYYKGVRVSYKIENHKSDICKYYLNYDIEFETNANEYIVAIAQNAFVQEMISNLCSGISDVITVPAIKGNIEAYEKHFAISNILKLIDYSDDGKTITRECEVEVVHKLYFGTYLHGIDKKNYDDIIILKYILNNRQNAWIRLHLTAPSIVMNKDDHYIYWVSDRPMFVEQIHIDASCFDFNGNANFNVQPLLVNYYALSPDLIDKKHICLNVHNWIAVNQGFIFSWR